MRSMLALCLTFVSSPLLAQTEKDSPESPPAQTEAAEPSPPQIVGPVSPVESSPNEVNNRLDDFKRFDDMRLKGWITPYPKIEDTIVADAGGVRSALADLGVGVLGVVKNTLLYNLRGDNSRAVYNGRNLTSSVNLQALHLTWDAGKIGLDGGQIIMAIANSVEDLPVVNGPHVLRIANLDYYQKLAGGRVEIKAGIFDNQQEYVGTSVGGSFASGTLGPKASILVQLGLSYVSYGAPAVNIRLNGKNGFYTKFGAQRSLPPGASNVEVPYNPVGLSFNIPGAKALFLGEFGRNHPAAPGEKSTWFRGGLIYNTTAYPDYRRGSTRKNWAAYGAADIQLVQGGGKAAAPGLYVGGTIEYAPPAQNVYTQYMEGRIYGIGLVPERPNDMVSFVLTYNKVSKDYQRYTLNPEIRGSQVTGTLSYSIRVAPGIYAQPGFGFVTNPSLVQHVPVNIDGYFSTTLLF